MLASRAIMIRGPSQNHYHKSAELYHQDNVDCGNTFNAHQALQTAISKDVSRQYSYWLIVFPENVVLENFVFSDDDTHVKRHENDMLSTYMNDGDEMDIPAISLYWRIAVSGGEQVKHDTSTKKKKFAFRKNP